MNGQMICKLPYLVLSMSFKNKTKYTNIVDVPLDMVPQQDVKVGVQEDNICSSKQCYTFNLSHSKKKIFVLLCINIFQDNDVDHM